MGCNCRGSKNVADPRTIPVRAKIQAFSAEPAALNGPATSIPYGKLKDGDEVLIWKIDALAAPKIFQVLAEGAQVYATGRPTHRRR